MFSLNAIRGNKSVCMNFINALQTSKPLADVINQAHILCPELKECVEKNRETFNSKKGRDKGNLGKIVEFYLFGQLPNCDPNPDLEWGGDIKATHFKKNKKGHYSAKERLTITNCGKTADYATFASIVESSTLKECKYYPKIQNGVLFVFEYDKSSGKYTNPEENLQKRLLTICQYDTETLPDIFRTQLQCDFDDIKNKITNECVSQKGQKYLHIHPHGSKNSTTKAFGFTNKFLTKLVAHCKNYPITEKGRSVHIERQHFN